MLADRHPAGAKVLVIGAPWLEESVRQAGLEPVRLAEDDPVAVVQGHSPDTGWRSWPRRASRCGPAPTGSPATSTPLCRPTAACCPATARWWPRWSPPPGCTRGWPASPNARCSTPPSAWSAAAPAGRRRPAGHRHRLRGRGASTPSLMVLTGVSTATDLLAADPGHRPTYLAFDLRGLVEEDRAVRIPGPSSTREQPGMDGRQRFVQPGSDAPEQGGERRGVRRELRCGRWPCSPPRPGHPDSPLCGRTTRSPRPR